MGNIVSLVEKAATEVSDTDTSCWYKANLYLCNSNCRPIKYDKDHGNNTCSS